MSWVTLLMAWRSWTKQYSLEFSFFYRQNGSNMVICKADSIQILKTFAKWLCLRFPSLRVIVSCVALQPCLRFLTTGGTLTACPWVLSARKILLARRSEGIVPFQLHWLPQGTSAIWEYAQVELLLFRGKSHMGMEFSSKSCPSKRTGSLHVKEGTWQLQISNLTFRKVCCCSFPVILATAVVTGFTLLV